MPPREPQQSDLAPWLVLAALAWLLLGGDAGLVPSPAPIKVDGFRVLIVEETAERGKLSREQLAMLFGDVTVGYLDSHCAKGPDGKTPEWRLLDKDVDLGSEAKLWQDAMATAKAEAKGVYPFVLVSNGKGGAAVPLPATQDEFLALLKRYAE